MKRKFFLVFAGILAVCLAGCGNQDAGIGIIGGADGPTEIIVAKPGGALTAEEVEEYEAFLNQPDVYGFLLSNYATPLDANYVEVFYNGAGVERRMSGAEVEAYMEENGWEELYGDLTLVPAEAMNAVIEKRTGYTLEQVLDHGNDVVQLFDKNGDFCFMHGDTNGIRVQAVSGMRNAEGVVILNSREGGGFDDGEGADPDDWSTFSTTLLERENADPLILSNTVTGGWRAEYLRWLEEMRESGPIEVTAEQPPFEGKFAEIPPEEEPLPVTLELLRETENNVSDPKDWEEEHWDEWMQDERFAAEQEPSVRQMQDMDRYYTYAVSDGMYNGQDLYIFDRDSLDMIYSIDFSEYLFLDGESAAPDGIDGLDAQSLRWARIINGTLYVANSHQTYAETTDGHNAYLTAVDLPSGEVLWRSDPLVCNSDNFAVLGSYDDDYGFVSQGVLVCGYGFTAEDDYIYQVSMASGRALDRLPVASAPDRIVCANGILYVHCYNRDYEFDVSYG